MKTTSIKLNGLCWRMKMSEFKCGDLVIIKSTKCRKINEYIKEEECKGLIKSIAILLTTYLKTLSYLIQLHYLLKI